MDYETRGWLGGSKMGVAGSPFGDLTFCQKSGCTCQMPFFGTFHGSKRVEGVDWVINDECSQFQVRVTSVTPVTSRDR